MPYISLDNLTQYNGRLRDYIDGSFDKLDGANWRKTSAAQSVSCWPIPESPLEPEVTFKFSETPPASGTKGPDNPSTIVGVEAVACHVCEAAGVNDTPYFIGLGDAYYGGSVNFATGVMTVTWGKSVITGTENWSLRQDSPSGLSVFNSVIGLAQGVMSSNASASTRLCSHFPYSASWASNTWTSWGTATNVIISRPSAEYPDAETFKNWLASEYSEGHPVTIVYLLNTPYTVSLTPVLVRSLPAFSHYVPRQNTIYTPHESVQVGYAKSALKTSEELTNAIISLGGNV